MTEQITEQVEERDFKMYRHTPGGSLWMDEPTFWRHISAADWKEAARVLETFMHLGEDVHNEALTIAFGDIKERVEVEAKRAQERESSEKTRHGLSPGEDARLLTLLGPVRCAQRREDDDNRSRCGDGLRGGRSSRNTFAP